MLCLFLVEGSKDLCVYLNSLKNKSTTPTSACRHMWFNANVISQQKTWKNMEQEHKAPSSDTKLQKTGEYFLSVQGQNEKLKDICRIIECACEAEYKVVDSFD
ncbi:uncharacterized protein LOC117906355 [Vitis riparia]|uniref:uncharacterized protein LOC117906355 n=1 Tax=Vitis riparia TaxID=96939 RepID=UPI00155AA14A|nr:uncharacterized protein LOC117906355 [Vitis riparia]